MEIMGLIVIVILLTVGMFFIVSFQASKPRIEVKQNFEDDQLASNFILSYLRTNTDCRKYTMEDMIQDCAVERNINCDDLSSCEYVNVTLQLFLNKTLVNWSKDYRFNISGMSVPIIFNNSCGQGREKDSAFQPISLYPYSGLVTVKLDICE